ncbi:chaperone NapD [Thaumasiovibrio subtropicus]|uniref:chaperone NapD n=1 Tax=Thaumasiovibrio subtropicus TaxID=1891207 RepID=UPI000B3501A7|nr:chaperone NapD [Thaumasiovibrio subtropicus]
MSEYHVSSLVVHAATDQVETLKRQLEAMPGTEVPAVSEVGKMVVVVEGDSRQCLVDQFETIRQLPGVLAATLVFHQQDNSLAEPARGV